MSQFPNDQGAGANGFSPLSFYDKPSVLVEQLLDGDASWASVRDTLFNADKLSPKERDSLGDRVREGLGVKAGPSLANGLIEAATNPLTWMVLLTAPQGLRVLGQTGGLAKKMGVKGFFPILQAMGLTTGHRTLDRLGAAELGHNTVRALAESTTRRGLVSQEILQAAKQGSGLKHLEADHPLVQELGAYVAIKRGGHDVEGVEKVLQGRRLTIQRLKNSDGSKDTLRPYGWVEAEKAPAEGTKEMEAWREGHKEYHGGWVNVAENQAATARDQQLRKAWSERFEHLEDRLSKATGTKRAELQQELDAHRIADKPGPEVATVWLGVKEEPRMYIGDEEVRRMAQWERANPWAKGVADRFKKMYEEDRQRLLMTEDGTAVDVGKYWRGARALKVEGESAKSLEGLGILADVEGVDLHRLLTSAPLMQGAKEGMWEREQFEKVLGEHLTKTLPEFYLPEGIRRQVKLTPEEMRQAKYHTANAKETSLETIEKVLPSAGGGFLTRVTADHVWHPADVDGMERLLGSDSAIVKQLRERSDKERLEQMKKGDHPTFVRRDPLQTLDAYQHRSMVAEVMDQGSPDEFTTKARAQWLKDHPKERSMATQKGDPYTTGLRGRLHDPLEGLPGGSSRRDHWENVLHMSANTADKDGQLARKQVQLTFEAATGAKSHTLAMHEAAFEGTRAYMGRLAETGVVKWLETNAGEAGRHFASGLRKIAEDGPEALGRSVGSNVARYLYSTHLGLNLGSVALNVTQPLLFVAPHLGFKATMQGMAETLKQFHGYYTERLALGRSATVAQKQALTAKHFPLSEEIGIQHDALHLLDEQILGGRTYKDGKLSALEGFMLKPFEVSERWNRVLTGNMVKAAYEGKGMAAKGESYLYDVHRFVSETQYGSSPLNTPRVFMEGWMSHPLMRQFLSFPLRVMTTAIDTLPNMGDPDSFGRSFLLTNMRALGASAAAYEMFKGTLGADVSKSLYASSVTDLVGGDRLLEKGNDWIYVPPVISIPKDLIAAISQDDHDAYAQALARVVPSGVMASKVMGVLPQMGNLVPGVPDPSDLQKTYVDWANPGPDGMYPTYSWDGKLIEFKSKMELYSRAAGLDLGKWTDVGKFDNYMVKQRESILAYKQRYLTLISNGDYTAAERVKGEFQQRYGVAMMIGKDQMTAFQNIRTQARSERILDRMPPEVKAQFQQMLANSDAAQTGLTAEQLSSAPTAAGREREFQGVPQEVVQEMQQRLRTPAFQHFDGF